MEKADERRAEKRLLYRWPVKFVADDENLSFQGQIVDIASEGMAFLCHAVQGSFSEGQKLKANFGVPYFESSEFFDTVLFERTGFVRRIDKPSSEVYRIAMQFAVPLFFNPGAQNINETELQQRLDTKNLSIVKAEESARAYNEALIKAEKQLRLFAQAKAKTEEKLKAEIEDRYRTEAKLRAEAQEKIRSYAENAARLEERLRATEKEISRITTVAEKADKKVGSLENQLKKIKEQTDNEIKRIRIEAAETISRTKAGLEGNAKQSSKKELLKKVDSLISDRNKIF